MVHNHLAAPPHTVQKDSYSGAGAYNRRVELENTEQSALATDFQRPK
jgi:hypothetical protein